MRIVIEELVSGQTTSVDTNNRQLMNNSQWETWLETCGMTGLAWVDLARGSLNFAYVG